MKLDNTEEDEILVRHPLTRRFRIAPVRSGASGASFNIFFVCVCVQNPCETLQNRVKPSKTLFPSIKIIQTNDRLYDVIFHCLKNKTKKKLFDVFLFSPESGKHKSPVFVLRNGIRLRLFVVVVVAL